MTFVMGTASPTAMEGCGCDLANALRANWGAKVDPMPEIGAAVDLPNLLLRGLATSPQTSRSVVGTTTAAPCGPTPSVSLLLVGVRSRCHQRAARFMACSEECVSSESGRIADPKPVDRADGGLASGVLVRRTGLRGIRGLPVAVASHGFARGGRRVAVPKETPVPPTGGGPGFIPCNRAHRHP